VDLPLPDAGDGVDDGRSPRVKRERPRWGWGNLERLQTPAEIEGVLDLEQVALAEVVVAVVEEAHFEEFWAVLAEGL